MRGHEMLTQSGDRAHRARRHHQLIRIRTTVMAYGDRLAAPHELRAARSEMTPPPAREVARLAVSCAVPPFHRQNAETVANAHTVHVQRLRQRRRRRRGEIVIEFQRNTASL